MNTFPWVQSSSHSVERKISIRHIVPMKATKQKSQSACPISSRYCSTAMWKAVRLSWLLTVPPCHPEKAQTQVLRREAFSEATWNGKVQCTLQCKGSWPCKPTGNAATKGPVKHENRIWEVELTLPNWGNSGCSNACILTQSKDKSEFRHGLCFRMMK